MLPRLFFQIAAPQLHHPPPTQVLQGQYTLPQAVSTPQPISTNHLETTIIQSPSDSSSSSSSSGGISGGAAAGIAIGVLLLIGIGAGAFFFIRRRQRRDAYQRQYEGSGFGSSPGSLNRPFGTDQRLEPSMVQKRESVGSLADEQDYSRKILRVFLLHPLGLIVGDESGWELEGVEGCISFSLFFFFR